MQCIKPAMPPMPAMPVMLVRAFACSTTLSLSSLSCLRRKCTSAAPLSQACAPTTSPHSLPHPPTPTPPPQHAPQQQLPHQQQQLQQQQQQQVLRTGAAGRLLQAYGQPPTISPYTQRLAHPSTPDPAHHQNPAAGTACGTTLARTSSLSSSQRSSAGSGRSSTTHGQSGTQGQGEGTGSGNRGCSRGRAAAVSQNTAFGRSSLEPRSSGQTRASEARHRAAIPPVVLPMQDVGFRVLAACALYSSLPQPAQAGSRSSTGGHGGTCYQKASNRRMQGWVFDHRLPFVRDRLTPLLPGTELPYLPLCLSFSTCAGKQQVQRKGAWGHALYCKLQMDPFKDGFLIIGSLVRDSLAPSLPGTELPYLLLCFPHSTMQGIGWQGVGCKAMRCPCHLLSKSSATCALHHSSPSPA
eukprot:1044195-Pelagomonas_calceolata.AAC.2